jgi:O-antigen ligase
LRELLGVVEHGSENMRTFMTRCAFTVFFINFIRTPRHVLMIYLVAVGFMVTSSVLSVRDVLQGGGFAGYRAASATVISAASNPNRAAMFSILAIAELYWVTTWIRSRVIWLIVTPIIAIMCLCVFLSASRSGLLGLAVCFITIIIEERFTLKTLLVAALLGTLAGLLVIEFTPEKSLERITNLPFTQGGELGEGASSLSRRAYTWEIAADIVRDNPVLGVGIGNWDLARFLRDPTQSLAAPHSSYFLALCEGGIFCLSAFLILLWRCWRNIRFAESYVEDPNFALPELNDLRWIIKSAKTDLVVLVFFSAFADLWQLVIVFWLVSIGIVLRRMFEQAMLAQVFEQPESPRQRMLRS